MKIIEIKLRTMKIMRTNLRNPFENHTNNENHRNPLANNENYDNHKKQHETDEIH